MEFHESVSDYALSGMQGWNLPIKTFESWPRHRSEIKRPVGVIASVGIVHTESSSPRVTPVDDGCLLREHACCWNKNGGEKRSKIEEREIREKREKRDDKRKRAHVWVSMKLKKTRVQIKIRSEKKQGEIFFPVSRFRIEKKGNKSEREIIKKRKEPINRYA